MRPQAIRFATLFLLAGLSLAATLPACQTDAEGDRRDEPANVRASPTPEDGSTAPIPDAHSSDLHADTPARRTRACPMALEGTSLEVERHREAVVLVFKASGHLDQLRARARRLARLHNERRAREETPPRDPAGEIMPHERMLMLRRSTATTEGTASGVEMHLRPREPDHLDSLYRHMRNMQRRLAGMDHRPRCPLYRMMELGLGE